MKARGLQKFQFSNALVNWEKLGNIQTKILKSNFESMDEMGKCMS